MTLSSADQVATGSHHHPAPEVFIDGISYQLGQVQPLEDALRGEVTAEQLEKLRAQGFGRCAVSAASPVDLARGAASQTLRRLELPASAVDAVIYTTCSYWSEPALPAMSDPSPVRFGRLVAERLLGPLGLERARLFGAYLGESGNFVSALRLAANLMRTEGLRRVLYLTADAIPRLEGEYRAMRSGVFLASDGAACCLISADRRSGFAVEGLCQRAGPQISSYAKGQGFLKYMAILNGVRATAGALFASMGAGPAEHRLLITNNYNRQTMFEFCDALGFKRAQLFLDNQTRLGHVFAGDTLISMADLQAAGRIARGDRLLLLSTGPITWGAVSVRVL